MTYRGKLVANNTLVASTTIPTVITTGGASTWNEISGKPFNTVDTTGGLTIYDNTLGLDTLDTIATIDYVDQQIDGVTTTLDDYALKSEIPDVSSFITADALTPYVEASSLTTVAYSGDYDDLLNKPVIPAATEVTVTQTLSSGTAIADIDVNGVTTTLYAPQGGGGSVTIDNKSLVEVNGVLQEAVPIYSETVTIPGDTYGPGLYLDDFSYPAGNDLDAYFISDNFQLASDAEGVYSFALKLDDNTVFDGSWIPSTASSHTYGGFVWYANNSSYEMYIEDDGTSPAGHQWRLHVYMNGEYINYGNVAAVCLYESGELPSGTTSLEDICTADGLTYSSVTTPSHQETTYHKLPNNYLDIITVKENTHDGGGTPVMPIVNGEFAPARLIGIDDINIYTGYFEDGMPQINISADIPKNYVGGKLSIGGNKWIYVDDGNRVGDITTFYTDDFYDLYDYYGAGDFYFTNRYSYYPDEWTPIFTIWGILHLGDIRQDPTDISIEGWESVLDSFTYDSINDRWALIWKEGISPRGDMCAWEIANGKQDINAWFLPIDNSTIQINSNGKIKTVYPACPTTTAGTYTLQATVDGSGNVTYTWI